MTELARDTAIWTDIQRLLPAWTWETDADYRLSYVQDSISSLTGIEVEDLLGYRILLEGSDRKAGANSEGYRAALRRKQAIECMAHERVLLNGQKVVLVDNAVPRFDADGRFTGYRGVSLNLSEVLRHADGANSLVSALTKRTAALEASLRRNLEEMSASNRLLREIVQNLGEGLMVTSGTDSEDPDNCIEMVNPAYLRLFDLKEKDVVPGTPVPEFLGMLARRTRMPQAVGKFADVNAQLARGKQVMMHVPATQRSFYIRATRRPSGGYVLVHNDVTELREQNAELRAARDAAEVASLAKSNFLATMSHEIRTPMNGIVGMADILAETTLDAEQTECVDTIRGAALALTSMISDILDFSKVEAGRMEIDEAPFELHGTIAEVCALLMPLAGGKGLNLVRDIATEVPRQVEGDGMRLRQVLLNLMGNAIKFTESGEVRLEISKVAERDNRLIFSVHDTGIGIPPDRLPSIFDPFEQVQSGQQRRFDGTGLGLAISRQLAEAMGGTIAARSTPGVGSVFEVVLPLPGVGNVSKPEAPAPGPDLRLDGLRILVVEDNQTNRLVVEKMLCRRGAEIETAKNGCEALELYDPERFDLVLMDISMPVMSGLAAARRIRARETFEDLPRRPIIALTGNAFEKDRADARAAGMDDFLSKPVRRDALLEAIHNQLHAYATLNAAVADGDAALF